jgi:hypothetical protein
MSLGRTRRRWKDNNELDLRKIRWGFMDWRDDPRQGQVEGSCQWDIDTSGYIKFWNFLNV